MKIVDRGGDEDGGGGVSMEKDVYWGRQQNKKNFFSKKVKREPTNFIYL